MIHHHGEPPLCALPGCTKQLTRYQKAYCCRDHVHEGQERAHDIEPRPCATCWKPIPVRPGIRSWEYARRLYCDNRACWPKASGPNGSAEREEAVIRRLEKPGAVNEDALRLLAAGEPDADIRRLANVSAEEIARARAALFRRAASCTNC